MRAPVSWLRSVVDLPADVDARDAASRLTAAGLQVERIDWLGEDISGVVVARVLTIEELTGFNKPVRWVALTDGQEERHVICGAQNFQVGDVVAYARPPAMLPGGVEITARTTYGHLSDGMLCSGLELGLSDDHAGILVLEPGLALGADVVEALSLRDQVLDVSINPDRGYALSIRGLARELATAYSLEFRDPADVTVPTSQAAGHDVRIDDPAGCDRYVARAVTGLQTAATSPAWLRRRLVLAGMRPVSLVVDVTNHVMLELGQPMHAFDRSALRGPIVVRRAAAGERLVTLDDVVRTLDVRDLVIADDTGPIALAGVMGGAATEIRGDTSEVVLESAHFDAVSIARTARRHRLGSEASRRYERGVDDELAPYAAQAAVSMLERLGAAAGATAGTDVDLRPDRPVISMAADLPRRIAGVEYADDVVARRLADVGCSVIVDGGRVQATPPPWRPDLRRDVDLVEEVVRLEGYDGLPSTLPHAPAGRGLTRRQRLTRQVGRALAGDGFAEVLSHPFVSEDIATRLMLAEQDARAPSVRITNPVSDEEPYLRPTLLPGLFDTAARSLGRGLPDVAMFEVGPVFRARPGGPAAPRPPAGVRPSPDDLAGLDAALPDQPSRVGVVLTGRRERAGWWGPGRPAVWADAIEAMRSLATTLGVPVDVAADPHPPFHPGRCAGLRVGGRLLGHAGELHPRVVAAFDLPARACAAEISLDVLIDAVPEPGAGPVVSAYPPATLDVAVVVPDDVPAAAVAAALREGAGELLEALRLFDVFAGEQLGQGRRSLAFSLRLRAPDRTLTAEAAVEIRDAALQVAAQRYGATLRT